MPVRNPAFAVLLSLSLPPVTVSAQVTDTTGALEASAIDSLSAQINWRTLIRVYRDGQGYELFDPRLALEGLSYDRARPLQEAGAAPLERPLPLDVIRRIEVREGGNHLLTGLAGAALGTALGYGLYRSFCEGTCDLSGKDVAGILGFGAFGGFIGVLLGEASYTWQPIYEVNPTEVIRGD